ncbi:MAG: hypothetical protein P8O10_16270 [Pseudorhodobacter sp.]|nr:hypothetical protein [Pseudorhodobacter sp.]
MANMSSTLDCRPECWQLVLIAWGDKYPVKEINRLTQAVLKLSLNKPRVVLISDRERPGLDQTTIVVPFPAYWLRPDFLRGGCQAKLAMFEVGVLPADLPSLYVDLDTMILRDVEPILRNMKSSNAVAMIKSANLPFGSLARLLYRISSGKVYARGNSSVVAFHPANCGYIAESFKRLEALHGVTGFKPLRADERFISWIAQECMQEVSRKDAVKFPTEFMFPWRWFGFLLQSTPWIASRRRNLRVVTFPGLEVKFEELIALNDGDEVVDRKGRRLIWSKSHIGALKEQIQEYWGTFSSYKS